MKRPVRFIAIIIGYIAALTALLAAVRGANQIPAAAFTPSENAIAQAEPSAAPSAVPEPTPEPVPTPEPLNIQKQELRFEQLAPTVTMSFEELVGDNGVYESKKNIPPVPSPDTYKLVINLRHQFGTVYKKDDNGAYTVPVRYFIVSTGASKTPTPEGTFEMGEHYVRFGKFTEFNVYGQYWRQIVRSIYCHSIIYESRNAHSYTISYNELGTRVSHGCVRMLVPDARWIYYNLGPGTVCEIIRGEKGDEQAKAIKEQLVLPKKPSHRPSLKPGEVPVTEAWPGWQGDAYAQYTAYLAAQEQPAETEADSEAEA